MSPIKPLYFLFKARNAREQERAEQLEAQRKEREIRNQQMMEV